MIKGFSTTLQNSGPVPFTYLIYTVLFYEKYTMETFFFLIKGAAGIFAFPSVLRNSTSFYLSHCLSFVAVSLLAWEKSSVQFNKHTGMNPSSLYGSRHSKKWKIIHKPQGKNRCTLRKKKSIIELTVTF